MKREIQVRIPGKVFLFGEYAILKGAPALLSACLGQGTLGFEARIKPIETFQLNNLHPDSPAGKLLKWAHTRFGLGLEIQWQSGFHELLGLGSSTAQFAACFAGLRSIKEITLGHGEFKDWELYRELTTNPQGESPSGADLIAQVRGGSSLISLDLKNLKPRFESLRGHEELLSSILIFSANHQKNRKIATHHHLNSIVQDSQIFIGITEKLNELREVTLAGVHSWSTGDASGFGWALNQYGDLMKALDLECEATSVDRRIISQIPGVFGIKGSGALQADLLIVCAEHAAQPKVIELAKARDLRLLSRGLPHVRGLRSSFVNDGELQNVV